MVNEPLVFELLRFDCSIRAIFSCCVSFKGSGYTFRGAGGQPCQNCFCLPSEKGSTQYGENLLSFTFSYKYLSRVKGVDKKKSVLRITVWHH